ncbi:unnamed protein product [Strongylus vulgaris]|uniref:Uncharacterized protein n=1 Tax=Strongylus vulgaris TaxID=40348 RepID=A0A3P7KGW7_STRVU|nr:unnamed protein product [Strongylus vulgaris]
MWAEGSGGEDDDLLGDARPFKQSNSQSLFLSREPTDTRHGRMQIDVGELMWKIRIHSRWSSYFKVLNSKKLKGERLFPSSNKDFLTMLRVELHPDSSKDSAPFDEVIT